MELSLAFEQYGDSVPENRSEAQRVSLSLRRVGILTTSELQTAYESDPEKIKNLRGIGPRAIDVIRDAVLYFKRFE